MAELVTQDSPERFKSRAFSEHLRAFFLIDLFNYKDFTLRISAAIFLGKVWLEMKLPKENRSPEWWEGEKEE